ncbi:DUF6339 family protein [Paenibacillus sp. Y412MC10]|uniref:DUF6339 family protein n=1 Tax=Geobacillus sp. (strain Y412MC10) TaxID=481743 RepID=UPI001C92C291
MPKVLLERSFSRNHDITKAVVLSVIKEKRAQVFHLLNRKNFRHLIIFLNQLVGVTIFDILDREE